MMAGLNKGWQELIEDPQVMGVAHYFRPNCRASICGQVIRPTDPMQADLEEKSGSCPECKAVRP